jgi:hypothetical protein
VTPGCRLERAIYRKEDVMAGDIDPTGVRKDALDAFLETRVQEGFQVETHTDTHAIVVAKKSLLSRIRPRGANRYVVSVDEHGKVTMIPAEPKRS